jgi:hypothetical protein
VALDNLGIVVFLNDTAGQSGEIAPAFVYVRARARARRYTVVFRTPRTTLREVRAGLRGPSSSAESHTRTVPGDFIRGTPVFLDFDVETLEPGRYVLHVVCVPVSANAAAIVRDFVFHHSP